MDVYRLSGAARRAIEAAEKEALALGHGSVEAAHLLLGLLTERNAGSVSLRRAGVAAEALRKAADDAFGGARDAGLGARAREPERGGEWREALAAARERADAAGEHEVAPVHLFLGATEDPEWSAARALLSLGVDVERARADAEALARDEAQGSLPAE